MKKVIYLLVLCMVLGMAGCGTNQENKEPVSGNVSVETENKENDDVVQNEQIADTGSYPPWLSLSPTKMLLICARSLLGRVTISSPTFTSPDSICPWNPRKVWSGRHTLCTGI